MYICRFLYLCLQGYLTLPHKSNRMEYHNLAWGPLGAHSRGAIGDGPDSAPLCYLVEDIIEYEDITCGHTVARLSMMVMWHCVRCMYQCIDIGQFTEHQFWNSDISSHFFLVSNSKENKNVTKEVCFVQMLLLPLELNPPPLTPNTRERGYR